MFFLAGAVLLALTYVLVWQGLNARLGTSTDLPAFRLGANFPGMTDGMLELADGTKVSVTELATLIREREEATRDAVLGNLLAQGAVALAGVGLVAITLGWLLARRALAPVYRITETAQRIGRADGRGLHERIQWTGPRDEVAKLVTTFNAMLERLDRSFDGQRRFVANASHEMRTPLAVQRALIEVTTTRQGTSADAKQLGDGLLEINVRHESLIDGLLTLADSQNEVTESVPVDLAEVAARALEVAAEPARARTLRVESSLEEATVHGDPVLLERLAHNLVENSVRHNGSGGWLLVETEVRAGAGVLVVSNSGPVIRAYDVETMFQPFRRLDRERLSGERGFGLGLSIVRAITHSHGGEVTAVPRPDGGLVVTVTLPARAAP
ncbi:HAMP domain-containing sensor histidine kinase [Actinophytocola sp.]|uniref:sensor histidine kinase n=1 Tax=Actinophytocola sp. TaxID=1872138 RepID=UPI002ED50AC0